MTTQKIRLTSAADVITFVKAAEKCRHDVDVSYNRVVIDAKSLVGVMSMDLKHTLTVRYSEDEHGFTSALDKFAVS